MQPEPSILQDQQVEAPIAPKPQEEIPQPEVKKPARKINFLTVFLVILLLAVAGLGYWVWQLNTMLMATQQNMATLQGNFDKLTTQKNSLSTELDTTRAELEKTKADLSTTQADLEKAQGETKSLREKMDKASKWMDVAMAEIVDNENHTSIAKKVDSLGDAKLKSLWKEFDDVEVTTLKGLTNAMEKLSAFRRYLLETIVDLLK